MPRQSYPHKALQLFQDLFTQAKAAVTGASDPPVLKLPTAEARKAAAKIDSILKATAEDIQDTLQHAQKQVNATLTSSGERIAHTLRALEKSLEDEIGDTEFETTASAQVANDPCVGENQPLHCGLPGLHPGGMTLEAYG